MLTILIFVSFSLSVLSSIHPCSPTDYEKCTTDEDCPENWECIDDTPPIPGTSEEYDGICVGPPDCDDDQVVRKGMLQNLYKMEGGSDHKSFTFRI